MPVKQVDGDHYDKMLIEPFELGYAVANGDSGFVKLVKYLTRIKDDRALQFDKAKHICDLRHKMGLPSWEPFTEGSAEELLLTVFCNQFPEKDCLEECIYTYLNGDFSSVSALIQNYGEVLEIYK